MAGWGDGEWGFMPWGGLVVVPSPPAGTGSGGVTDYDEKRITRIPFWLEYTATGIKAFITQEWYDVFGVVSQEMIETFILVGIIKKINEMDLAAKGTKSIDIESILDLKGLKKSNIELFKKLYGTKSVSVTELQNFVGQVLDTIEIQAEVQGVKKIISATNIDLLGIKSICTDMELDVGGVKKVFSELTQQIKGKRDLRKIITSLFDLEE